MSSGDVVALFVTGMTAAYVGVWLMQRITVSELASMCAAFTAAYWCYFLLEGVLA